MRPAGAEGDPSPERAAGAFDRKSIRSFGTVMSVRRAGEGCGDCRRIDAGMLMAGESGRPAPPLAGERAQVRGPSARGRTGFSRGGAGVGGGERNVTSVRVRSYAAANVRSTTTKSSRRAR